jgi:catechol 2,3-dioxygenase-like lactoylglutathione lyase family enzyme
MQIAFVAGFAPIVTDLEASRAFYRDALGVTLDDSDYPSTEALPGLKHFGLWTLAGAAQSCFGGDTWPADLPVPQGCLEFDVADADAVAVAAKELQDRGHRLLVEPKTEEWGQTVARLLSPEGLLIGVTFTPWLHDAQDAPPSAD